VTARLKPYHLQSIFPTTLPRTPLKGLYGSGPLSFNESTFKLDMVCEEIVKETRIAEDGRGYCSEVVNEPFMP